MADDVLIRIGAQGVQNIQAAFTRIQAAGQRLGRTLAASGRALATVGRGVNTLAKSTALATAGAGGAAAALAAFTRAGVDSVAETARFARAVGMTAEQYTALRFAAQRTGLDVDALNGFLINLADKGFDAFNGAEGSAQQLADLGVSAVDAQGNLKPLNQLFLELADNVAKMEDGTRKTGALSILAGDDGARAIDLLNLGSAGISRQTEEARRLGLVVTSAEADLARTTKNSIEGLLASVRATRDAVALTFAPDIQRNADAFAETLAENRKEIVALAESGASGAKSVISDLYAVFSGKGQPKSDFLARNAQDIRDIVSALTGNTDQIRNPAILEARNDLIGFAEAAFEAVKAIGRAYLFLSDVYSDFKAIASGEGSIETDFMKENAQNVRDLLAAFRGDRDAIESPALLAAYDLISGLGNAAAIAGMVVADLFNVIALNDQAQTFTEWGELFKGFYLNFVKPTKDLIQNAVLGIVEALKPLFGNGGAWFAVGAAILVVKSFNGLIGTITTTIQSFVAIRAAILATVAGFQTFYAWLAATSAWSSFTAGLASIQAALAAFGSSAMALLANPIVLAIVAVVAALVGLYFYWDEVKAAAIWAFEKIQDGLSWLGERAAEAWDYLTGKAKDAFDAVAGLIGDAFDTVVSAVSFVVDGALELLGRLWDFVATAPERIGGSITTAFNTGLDAVRGFYDDARAWVGDAVNWIFGRFDWLGDQISGVFTAVIDRIKGAWDTVKGLFRRAGEIIGIIDEEQQTQTPTNARSGGGLIRGPGSGTSDSVLARVSNGEYVVRAAAVRRLGRGVLDSINRGILPAFATGGLVGMPAMALSGIGVDAAPVSGRPVILNLPDGSQAQLRGDADAVGALEKRLRRSATAQATRKPRWYR